MLSGERCLCVMVYLGQVGGGNHLPALIEGRGCPACVDFRQWFRILVREPRPLFRLQAGMGRFFIHLHVFARRGFPVVSYSVMCMEVSVSLSVTCIDRCVIFCHVYVSLRLA